MAVGAQISPEPRKMLAHRKVLETVCTACQSPFQLAEEVYQCPACVGYHHLACWDMTHGCPGREGAPASGTTAATESPPAVAPVPELAAMQATEASVQCPECGLINPASALHCDCGHAFQSQTNKNLAEDERLCPTCAEVIKAKALKCRFCGHVLDSRLVEERRDIPIVKPPSLHWVLTLVLTPVTLGLFSWFWCIRISIWARKANHANKPLVFYSLSFLVFFAQGVLLQYKELASLLQIAATGLFQMGNFSFRKSMQEHYNKVEPGQLQLGGAMTFFFSYIYFQYHFNRLSASKKSNTHNA
jgi:hypothetical protein